MRRARLILWDGYCHVHTRFQVEHVSAMREAYPDARVVVHPECTADVVALADASGSTCFIVKYVMEAPPGSTIIIGTEINMVNRLAKENTDKKVVPLARSLCPNMFKTSLSELCYTLEELPGVNEISVPEFIADDARVALKRMLTL